MNKNLNEIKEYVLYIMKNSYQSSEKHISYCTTLLNRIIDSISLMENDSSDVNDNINKYLETLEENKDQYPQSVYFQLKRLSNLLKRAFNDEDITLWKYERHFSKFNVSHESELLICAYQNFLSATLKQSTVYNRVLQIRKFLFYLENKKNLNVQEMNMSDIYDYFYFIRIECKQSVNDVINSLKSFISFLSHKDINHKLNKDLISRSAPAIKRNYSMFSREEMRKILSVIDVDTDIGKRDFAILSLAMTTALRSIDIATLKLTDINWNLKQICITQNKTGNVNILPLCKETGDAIAEYIMKARPETNSEYIFIRSKRPYTEINKKGTIQNIFLKYRKLAGLEHQLNDGRTMHGIRRSVASLLTNQNTDINIIAQILGHSQLSSIKIYASVDTCKLRVCSLSLEDYPIMGGLYHEI